MGLDRFARQGLASLAIRYEALKVKRNRHGSEQVRPAVREGGSREPPARLGNAFADY
jgi:hypothetical protein